LRPDKHEEANHAFGLLEGLNQSVEKNAVKTAVAEFYVIVVMFVEGVHRALLLCCQILRNLEPVNPSATTCSTKLAATAAAKTEKEVFL
jgi:hypothetical protein